MNIGIVGKGFVGTAVFEGMSSHFNVLAWDKNKGWETNANFDGINCENYAQCLIDNNSNPIFVCVPTPMLPTGECDTSIVESIVKDFNDIATKPLVLVIKSTVSPGTTSHLNAKYKNVSICFNPEFLTEANSINDFKNQDRIVIGGPLSATIVAKAMFNASYPHVPVIETDSTTAEMIKYTTNCFLATKVSFANEIKQICDSLEIDYNQVIAGATKDKRLGTSHWQVPGPDGKCGWGLSCFPKDLNALIYKAKKLGIETTMLEATWNKNLEVRPEKDWEQLKGRAVKE